PMDRLFSSWRVRSFNHLHNSASAARKSDRACITLSDWPDPHVPFLVPARPDMASACQAADPDTVPDSGLCSSVFPDVPINGPWYHGTQAASSCDVDTV